MKLGRLNHIGVATPSIADSIVFTRDVMGACIAIVQTLQCPYNDKE
jgi:hypothetical protein